VANRNHFEEGSSGCRNVSKVSLITIVISMNLYCLLVSTVSTDDFIQKPAPLPWVSSVINTMRQFLWNCLRKNLQRNLQRQQLVCQRHHGSVCRAAAKSIDETVFYSMLLAKIIKVLYLLLLMRLRDVASKLTMSRN